MSTGKSTTAQQGFGRRGPGMAAPVEKPKDGGKTLHRLTGYFREDRRCVVFLALAVVISVLAGVLAPRLQSSAIDGLVAKDFASIPPLLAMMLGLYIVKTILGSHGEDITVTSRDGVTTFTFTLTLTK